MTGDIHDAQVLTAGQVYVGKPQLDRDAPFFFLFQAVRVDACDRLHEGGLAVVDVPGGAQDDLFQRFTLLMAFYAERPAALFFGTSMESRSPVAVSPRGQFRLCRAWFWAGACGGQRLFRFLKYSNT